MKKIEFSFLKKRTRTEKICLSAVVFIGLLSLGLFYRQYRYFKIVSAELFDLKEDYRVYTLALKKMLNEKSKTLLAENGGTKKKIESQTKGDYYGWPFSVDASEVVSSDVQIESFIPLNRDTLYLRNEAIEFARPLKLNEQVAQLFDIPEWQRHKKPAKKTKKKVDTQKRIVGTSSRIRSLRGTDDYGKKDYLFLWPIERSKFWLSSLFGPRKMKNRGWRYHYGIDMAALKGTPVKAAASGIVLESGWNNGYGNYILVAHNRKYKSRYAHLSRRRVKVGQKVSRGQVIGAVGDTGLVRKSGKDASHLHFEVHAFGRHINPLSVLA